MSAKILMIEHDSDDRWLTEETFLAEGIKNPIDFIYGNELSDYLSDPDNAPSMILLSLQTTLAEDLARIKHIRSLNRYEGVPIVVLSESVLATAVKACYDAGATSFIQKPATYSQAVFKIKSFINYWFRTVELQE